MPGYIFPKDDKTHQDLLRSIEARRRDEEQRQRVASFLSSQQGLQRPPMNYGIAGAARATEARLQSESQVLPLAPQQDSLMAARQPQQVSGAYGQDVVNTGITPREPSPQQGVGRRANEWRTQSSGQPIDRTQFVDEEGTITSYGLDPLGNELMITHGPANENTAPKIHLFGDQVDALDTTQGYLEQLQSMYPDHDVTERSAFPEPGIGETMEFMGNVAWQSYDVVQGLIAEPIAQTAIELLPFTEGAAWNLTVTEEGWTGATEAFRERPMWQQMVFGALFDPFTLLAGLGLLRSAKLGIPITVRALKSAIKRFDSSLTDEQALEVATAAKGKLDAADPAGEGSWRGPEGTPRKADGSEYTPQEVLQMGGRQDVDLDGPLPEYTAADWDRGIEKIVAEQVARQGFDEESLREVIEKIGREDRALFNRVVDQMAPGETDWDIKNLVYRRFIRTALHALDAAQAEDGGKWIPQDFGREAVRALRREQDRMRIAKPEGGELVTPPEFPPESVIREGPQPTVAIEPGAPTQRPGQTVRRMITGETETERLNDMSVLAFGADVVTEPGNILALPARTIGRVPQTLRQAYEAGQAMWLDKFAVGNAASSRAHKNFLGILNRFVDEDIGRVNKKMLEDFMEKHGLSARAAQSDARLQNMFIKRGDPGFSPIRRMPAEFNFEWQAALTSGAPGAAVNHSRSILRNVRQIVRGAKSTAGKQLDIEYVNLYLSMRHAIDIIKVKNHANRIANTPGNTGSGIGLVPQSDKMLPVVNPAAIAHPGTIYNQRRVTGPGGQSQAELMNALQIMMNDLKGHEVIRNIGGREVVTNQWEETVRASRVVTDHYRNMLNMQVSEGLVTTELADQLKRQYRYYNPIKYVEGTLINIHNPLKVADGNRSLVRGVAENDIRLLAEQGIDADIVRPLEHLSNVTMRNYLAIFRNRAMKALIPTLIFDPRNAARVAHIIDDGDELTTSLNLRQRRGRLDQEGSIRVARMINGKADIWEIPKEFEPVVDALVAFDSNMAERTLRWINKVPRSLLTAHNPVFFTYNFLHDTLAAFLVEGIMPWTVATDLMRNLVAIFRDDALLDEMSQMGARVGGFAGQSAEDIAGGMVRGRSKLTSPSDWVGGSLPGTKGRTYIDTLREARVRGSGARERIPRWRKKERITAGGERVVSRQWERGAVSDPLFREEFDTFTKWRRWATSPIRLVGDVADAVEQAPRRSVYSKVRNKPVTGPLRHIRKAAGGGGMGLSKQEAALRARRITVDFQRRGRAVGLLDAAFLYTNAAIQGSMLPLRAIKQDFRRPADLFTGSRLRMGGLSGVAAALYFWNTQDGYGDAFDQMSAIDKYTKLNVITGKKWHPRYGQMLPTSIAVAPLLREFSLFTAPMTFVLQKLRGRSEQAHFQQMATSMVPSLVPFSHLLNVGGRDSEVAWQGLPTPTAIGNLISETAKNHDEFRNQPIVSDQMKMNEDKRTHYDAYTSRAAIQVGKIFNQSPKLIDHWMRVGALRDIIYSVDMLSRYFDPEEIDPELGAMANELEEYIEMNVPSELALWGDSDLVETTIEGKEVEWKSKNNARIINQFFRDNEQYVATTSEERRQLSIYLDKKAREDREYSYNGEPVAFATNFINRFMRTQGGNMSRLGQIKAAEEFDVSTAQTREAAGKLNVIMEQLRGHQLVYDGNLWGGHRESGEMIPRPGVDEATPRNQGHYMDGQEWIDVHRQKGSFYAMAMFVYAGELHRAAQLQGIDISKEYGDWNVENFFVRDATFWSDYKTAVATGAGAWKDQRPVAAHLAAGYRGITMTYLQPGIPDFTTFFEQREDYRTMIEGQAWGRDDAISGTDMWERVEAEITATMTATEYEWYSDMREIRDYWDIAREFTTEVPSYHRPIWERYLDGNEAQRLAMKANAYTGSVITYLQKEVNERRELHRTQHPSMDAKYIKWGYASEPMTYAGEQARQWLLHNVQSYSTLSQPNIAAQEPVIPSNMYAPAQPLQGGR